MQNIRIYVSCTDVQTYTLLGTPCIQYLKYQRMKRGNFNIDAEFIFFLKISNYLFLHWFPYWYLNSFLYSIVLREHSANVKMKNFKIKNNFVKFDRQNARANQTSINFMIFILLFVENCL